MAPAAHRPDQKTHDLMNTPAGEEWKAMEAAGRHPDPDSLAADLEAARSRIRKIRMTDAEILVTDRAGRPLVGLPVSAVQTHSPFCWGEQLWQLDTLFRGGFRDSDRARHFTRLFTGCLNSANCLSYWTEAPRNDGPKHMEFQGEDRLDGFAAQVDWCLANGLTPKGHPVFWSLDKAYPEWLKRYPMETQWKFIEVRVRNLVARFRGKVKIWDVINEPMWEAAPKHLPHRHWPHLESLDDICEYVIPVLRWAREEDPDAAFLINDYGMELDPPGRDLRTGEGVPVTAKSQRDRFVALFQRLRGEGAAPDGLGMQAHTGAWISPSQQLAILDDFAGAGVPLHYTEFWADGSHLVRAGVAAEDVDKLRAGYIAQVMTVAFSHPSVASFSIWGDLVESFGFRQDHNSCGLPSSSNRPTVVYETVRRLLREDFMTREDLVTDPHGRVRFRGFLGDYSLRYHLPSGMPVGTAFSLDPAREGPIRLVLNM
jgi:GH35 family endo-1,4-beta-xylanase